MGCSRVRRLRRPGRSTTRPCSSRRAGCRSSSSSPPWGTSSTSKPGTSGGLCRSRRSRCSPTDDAACARGAVAAAGSIRTREAEGESGVHTIDGGGFLRATDYTCTAAALAQSPCCRSSSGGSMHRTARCCCCPPRGVPRRADSGAACASLPSRGDLADTAPSQAWWPRASPAAASCSGGGRAWIWVLSQPGSDRPKSGRGGGRALAGRGPGLSTTTAAAARTGALCGRTQRAAVLCRSGLAEAGRLGRAATADFGRREGSRADCGRACGRRFLGPRSEPASSAPTTATGAPRCQDARLSSSSSTWCGHEEWRQDGRCSNKQRDQ